MVPGRGLLCQEKRRGKEDIPEYQPGDKIYKLFSHDKVRVRGSDEEFIIRVARLKKE